MKICVYSCDICGALYNNEPQNYITYWTGCGKGGEKHIRHICDRCFKELSDRFEELKNSQLEEIVFAHPHEIKLEKKEG